MYKGVGSYRMQTGHACDFYITYWSDSHIHVVFRTRLDSTEATQRHEKCAYGTFLSAEGRWKKSTLFHSVILQYQEVYTSKYLVVHFCTSTEVCVFAWRTTPRQWLVHKIVILLKIGKLLKHHIWYFFTGRGLLKQTVNTLWLLEIHRRTEDVALPLPCSLKVAIDS